ncbi:MAG: phosphoribosyltransferase family protein [Acidimicrobiales bacterium]
MDERGTAGQLLLRAFRWTHGRADFADALRDPDLLAAIGPALAGPFAASGVTAVVALEARGFVVGGLVARELGVGLVLARKPGAVHPDSDGQAATAPDWRGRHVEILISRRAVRSGDCLLLVDDWIETGSQARTVSTLAERRGADVVGVSVLVDDTPDDVREELTVVGLVRSSELPPDA